MRGLIGAGQILGLEEESGLALEFIQELHGFEVPTPTSALSIFNSDTAQLYKKNTVDLSTVYFLRPR